MTQQFVHKRNTEIKYINGVIKNASVQTGCDDDFTIFLSNNKVARVYFSNAYKADVLCFHFGSKSFICTKAMWNILKSNFSKIDFLLSKND